MAEEFISVRIRLEDAKRFATDAALDAAAIKGIGDAADTTSVRLGRASKSSFAHSQALYTMRRAAFAATGALVGLGTAAVFMGIRFNSTMEQNTISLSHFLGSTHAATAELNTLYQLAAKTPFEFPQLTAAASRFLAFGFSLRETNQDLKIIGDTAAGLGAGAEGIDRLVLVFGQMHATGRILGNDLLQLAALGVPALTILQKQLHLTADQMRQLQQGNLQISADVGIPALMRGLQQQFGGLSRLQAESFQGLTSTLHDYAAQLAGIVTHPLFVKLEHDLRRLNPLMKSLGDAFKAGGWTGMIQTLDQSAGAGGRLTQSWQQLQAVGQDLWRIFTEAVVPALKLVWAAIGLGSPVTRALIGLLGVLGRHTTLLKIALAVLAARYVSLRIVTWLAYAAQVAWNAVIWAGRVAVMAFTAAQWALNVAMDANPIGLLVVGAAALGVALAVLVFKVQAVRQAFVDAFNWVKQNWPLLVGLLVGPFGVAVALIVTHFETVKRWFTSVLDWVRGTVNSLITRWNHLRFGIPGFTIAGVHVPGAMVGTPDIPLLAGGGVIQQTGLAVVHRDETVLPARVQPLTLNAALNAAGGEQEVHVHVHLGEREVAESVTKFPQLLADAVFRQVAWQGARA